MILGLIGDQVTIADVVILMVAGLLGIPALWSRRKSEAIKELEVVLSSKDEYIATLEKDKEGLKIDRDQHAEARRQAENDAAGCRAAYEELEKYAAPQALQEVGERLAHLEKGLITAIQGQGELVMKNTEVLTDIRGLLERGNYGQSTATREE